MLVVPLILDRSWTLFHRRRPARPFFRAAGVSGLEGRRRWRCWLRRLRCPVSLLSRDGSSIRVGAALRVRSWSGSLALHSMSPGWRALMSGPRRNGDEFATATSDSL